MSTAPAFGSTASGRRRPLARILLLAALGVSWAILVPYMWKSVTTVPSAARLQAMQSRILHVPSPRTFLSVTAQSFAELALLAALLWPWWRRFWLSRLALAIVALATWAIVTMPLELTEIEWLHHRWMVGLDVLLTLAFILSAVTRIARSNP